jgi:hypothetical protein
MAILHLPKTVNPFFINWKLNSYIPFHVFVIPWFRKIMSYEIMSIRTTFHRFVIWNVVLVYEKLSPLRLSWNVVLSKEIIFKSLRCFIILLNTLITIKFLNDWMQIKVQIMEGQEYTHLLDYMSEKKDRKNSIFECY